jgi:predicted acyl esterase
MMNSTATTPDGAALSGSFLDGPLVGLHYRTPTQKGITDNLGRFDYLADEDVTFSVGTLDIGTANAAEKLTVASLRSPGESAPAPSDTAIPATINRARFVQSLGRDPDLRNGVVIDAAMDDVVSAHGADIVFDRDTESFEADAGVRAVFDELGLRFRGVAEARNHLRRTLTGIKLHRDVKIPTRDGSYLVADVFLPVDAEPQPVLMRVSAYGKAFEWGSVLDEAGRDASEEREAHWFDGDRDDIIEYYRYAENAGSASASTWVPRGYVVIRVDPRGIGTTPGKVNVYSKQEATDYYDAIQWAAEQPWSDGNVGLYGASYLATIQWNVAALRPPALKAIAPLASDADAYRDLAYPGGIFMGNYRRFWFNDMVLSNSASRESVDTIGGMAAHPWDDEFYRGDGPLSADFAKIDIPVLTAVSQTGMLHARGGFEAFAELASPAKKLLVLDASYFSYIYEDCFADLEAFFDLHLKRIKPEQEPPAVRMIMRTGSGGFEWRDEAAWPVPGTEYVQLFLDAGNSRGPGGMTGELPADIAFTEYSADVQAAASPLPMAVFDSAPLDEDIELAGHFRARLWVSSTSTDADLFVALRVMDGENEISYQTRNPGSAAPLTWGCLKVSHRALDPRRSTTERPWHTHRRQDAMPVTPGDVVEVEVEMMAATGRIKAGHRLRVEISPAEGRGATPGFERDYDESYHRNAVNRVFTGKVFPSSMTIPRVPQRPNTPGKR